MKTSFLEFLFRTGRVAPAILAKAQLEQLRQLPSPIDIAARQGLLGPEELIQVLLRQRDGDLTFVQAARQLGLWTATLEKMLQEEYASLRLPLLTLLREGGLVSAEDLTGAWAAYEAEPVALVAATPAQAIAGPGTEMKPLGLATYEAPPASPFASAEAPEVDPLVEEIFYETRELLRQVISGSSHEAGLVQAFHRLKGVLRFRGLSTAERWAELGEALFRELPRAPVTALPKFARAGEELLGAVLLGDAPDPRRDEREEAVALCLSTLPRSQGEAA